MTAIAAPCVYFSEGGAQNTVRTLELARDRAATLGIDQVLVASTSGATGVLAARLFHGPSLIVVSHSAGFQQPDTQELTAENRLAIESAGARILICQHALGGVGRAVRRHLGSYQVDEIIAHTLRVFGDGIKVAAEIALMAADAGMVRTDVAAIAIAGSGRGADTAAILLPTNAQTFFALRFLEIICMPSPVHPAHHYAAGAEGRIAGGER